MNEQSERPFDAFIEHQRKAAEEALKAIESLIPPDFREHGGAALKQSLEGFQILFNAVVDTVTESLDREGDDDDTAPSNGKTKIKVEVS